MIIKLCLKILFLSILLFSSCKKYPENTLWFKSIKKIHFFGDAKITTYTVNGNDSLDGFNKYLGSKNIVKDIKTCYFYDNYEHSKGGNNTVFVLSGGSIPISYEYSKNRKQIVIYSSIGINDPGLISKNVFVKYRTTWDIVKLEPLGTKKIKSIIDGNNYEIQFN